MKKLSGAALAGLALAALVQAASAEPAKLSIGQGVNGDFLTTYIAKDKGIFDKHNLDVTLVGVPVPSNIGPALVSGGIQIGAATPVATLQAREAGADIVVIAGNTRITKDNVTTSLVTRKGVTVKTAEDLKGRRVGVPGLNSGNYMLLAKWVLDRNVALKDVSFVEIGTPQMADLLRNGTVDAVVINEPSRTLMVNAGAGDLSVAYVAEVNPDAINIFWTAMGDWAATHHDTLAAFRAAQIEAMAFIKSNPDETRDVEKKHLNFNSPQLATFNPEVKPEDLVFFQKMGKQLGFLHEDTDPAKAIFH